MEYKYTLQFLQESYREAIHFGEITVAREIKHIIRAFKSEAPTHLDIQYVQQAVQELYDQLYREISEAEQTDLRSHLEQLYELFKARLILDELK